MLYLLFYAIIGLRRLRGIKYKNHTRLIREVKQAQIRLNLLIGLMRIMFKYNKVYKMSTAIIRSLFLKSEKFFLFVSCRETQHRALVFLNFYSSIGV